MRRGLMLGTTASLCLLVGAVGCSGGNEPSKDETVDELSETLQAGGVEEDAADCMAEKIVDEVGVDEVNDLDLTADEPSAELQDEIAAAAVDCGTAGPEG
jgi:hypothetical protein